MKTLKPLLGLTLAASLATHGAHAAEAPARPRILGISHVAFRVSDLARARAFYQTLLGHVTDTPPGAGAPLQAAINERQYVTLRAGLAAADDRLDHVALETDDVEAMRSYLAARGVDIVVRNAESGNPAITVRDPDGWALEFVQHTPETWPRKAPAGDAGRAVSRRMLHAGILVGDLDAANRFYGGILGLVETWRGSRSGTELSWTNMKVPDGDDYLEFMLYDRLPAPDARGTPHHICLQVDDLPKAQAILAERVAAAAYTRALEPRVGTNRKRQLNLFDADGTRVELMEPNTVDGQPVPPSTAPPPRRAEPWRRPPAQRR
jgi:lactoylglutathione lyase